MASSKLPPIDFKALSSVNSLLIALFYPTRQLNFLLAPKTTGSPVSIHWLLQIVPEIRKCLDKFYDSEPTKRLYIEICKLLSRAEPTGVFEVLNVLFTIIFGISPLIEYTNGQAANVHVVKVQTAGGHLHLENLLRISLQTNKFRYVPLPLLFVGIARSPETSNSYVLPALQFDIQEMVTGGTPQQMYLSAVICKTSKKEGFNTFVRYFDTEERNGSWKLYQMLNKTCKVSDLPKLEHNFKFWANLSDFKLTKIPEPLEFIMQRAVLCLYLPIINTSSPVSRQSSVEGQRVNSNAVPQTLPANQSTSSDVNMVQQSHQDFNAHVHEPGATLSTKIGQQKGIEGNQNSCFIDSLLMAWIYTSSNLKELLFPLRKNSIAVKLHDISNKITNYPFFCEKEAVWGLRRELSSINPKVIGEMMDVDEFISTLLNKALGSPYYLEYITNTSQTTGNYLHQIMLNRIPTRNEELGRVSTLLGSSMEYQGLKFNKSPFPILMIKMPRSNGVLVGYDMILPDLHLDISQHAVCGLENPHFSLHAVVCLHHMHYTSYILYKQQETNDSTWLYFDSMGLNGPVIKDLTDLGSTLELLSNGYSSHRHGEVSKLLKGIHLCIYVPSGVTTVHETPSMAAVDTFTSSIQIVETNSGEPIPVQYFGTERSFPDELKCKDTPKPMEIDTEDPSDLKSDEIKILKSLILALNIRITVDNDRLNIVLPEESIELMHPLKHITKETDSLISSGHFNNVLSRLKSLTFGRSDFLTVAAEFMKYSLKETPALLDSVFNRNQFFYIIQTIFLDYRKVNTLKSIFEKGIGVKNWHSKLLYPLPNVLMIAIERYDKEILNGKVFPSLELDFFKFAKKTLPEYETYKQILGCLESIVCDDIFDQSFYVYRRTQNPIVWNFFEISKSGDIVSSVEIPLLENYLSTLSTNDSNIVEKPEPVTNVEIHSKRILEKSVFIVYSLSTIKDEDTRTGGIYPCLEIPEAIGKTNKIFDDRTHCMDENFEGEKLAERPCVIALPNARNHSCLTAILFTVGYVKTEFDRVFLPVDECYKDEVKGDILSTIKKDIVMPLRNRREGNCIKFIDCIRKVDSEFSKYEFPTLWTLLCKSVLCLPPFFRYIQESFSYTIPLQIKNSETRFSSVKENLLYSYDLLDESPGLVLTFQGSLHKGLICDLELDYNEFSLQRKTFSLHAVLCQSLGNEFTVYLRCNTPKGVTWLKRDPLTAHVTKLEGFEQVVIQLMNQRFLPDNSDSDLQHFVKRCAAAFYVPKSTLL